MDEHQKDQSEHQPQRVRRAAVGQFWGASMAQREHFGQFSSLLDTQLRLKDWEAFQNYTRLTPELFDEVLQRVAPLLRGNSPLFKQPHSPGLKLAVTRRHLSTWLYWRQPSVFWGTRLGVEFPASQKWSRKLTGNCASVQRWSVQSACYPWSMKSEG